MGVEFCMSLLGFLLFVISWLRMLFLVWNMRILRLCWKLLGMLLLLMVGICVRVLGHNRFGCRLGMGRLLWME